ncbi:MAG: DUF72 domain-containing protein [bacterium]|nr:DUF72 domain-containing protein [bacterium]
MKRDNLRIGTAGFSYPDWLGNFYPQFCPAADFLRYYAMNFTSVELDGTFYRIPTPETVKKWGQVTPEGFVFAAKFPRTVTHEGDLPSRLEQAERFIDVMRRLGPKLGPLVLQFPYSFKHDSCEIFKGLVEAMPKDLRIVVELRNKCWLEEELFKWLRKREISLCLVDHPWVPRLKVKTAGFQYIRFLGDREALTEDFSYIRFDREEELKWWSDLVKEFSNDRGEIYGYFNNHYSGHAPSTAYRFSELLTE